MKDSFEQLEKLATKKERRNLIYNAVSNYNAYSLNGVSDALIRIKKNLNLIDKDSNISRQVEKQKVKHFIGNKLLGKWNKQLESFMIAGGAASTIFNYSSIRDSVVEALNLSPSNFDPSKHMNLELFSNISNYATTVDGIMLLGITAALTTIWYQRKKLSKNLLRKPLEEEIALYGDKDPELAFRKGEINKAIRIHGRINIEAVLANAIDSWGNKGATYSKLLGQHVILTIHNFTQNKLYGFLEKFIGSEKMNKLKESTKNSIERVNKNIRKTKRRLNYKTIFERQVLKLKKLSKNKEVLNAKDSLRKKLNGDVEKINERVYDEMLSMGIHQAIKRATTDIFLSKDDKKIKKGISILVKISDLNNVVSSDGINQYTIVSRTASKILKRYRDMLTNPSNSKEVKNMVRQISRSELFKFAQKMIDNKELEYFKNVPTKNNNNQIDDGVLNNYSKNKDKSTHSEVIQRTKKRKDFNDLLPEDEYEIKEILSKMKYRGYNTYKKTLREEIDIYCKEEKAKDDAVKKHRVDSSDEAMKSIYQSINIIEEPTLSDRHARNVNKRKNDAVEKVCEFRELDKRLEDFCRENIRDDSNILPFKKSNVKKTYLKV